ncbi:MAG TPA: type I-E CRISPR-associated protein Cse1/CasA [Anaerolineae bacterium]|nr:type I-E CRISPR-associated protein Cse1/CasA [Anaerolineae bacterium]
MSDLFNLIHEAWIPCIRRNGASAELSLRQTLAEAHALRELYAETPPVTAALHRLLLAVMHRVFGPKRRADWQRLWEAGHFDMGRLDAYLGKWRHRFNLFDSERPFYQSRYKGASEKSVVSLVLEMASGNNATLFDHHTETASATLTPAQAARAVLTSQAFGFGGLSGMPEKFTDAPGAKGILFFAQGDSLFETLMLNLIRYPQEGGDMPSGPDDQPAWEMNDPFKPDRSTPHGYLDYLTWHNRCVLLLPERAGNEVIVQKMIWGPGLRLEAEVRDPMKHYREDKRTGFVPLSFNSDRALWRDSSALLQLKKSDTRPPTAFFWLSTLIDEDAIGLAQVYRFMALGLSKDQAKLEFFRSEALPLPLKYLHGDLLVDKLSTSLGHATDVARRLNGAVFTLARLILKPATTDEELAKEPGREERDRINQFTSHWAIDRYYWSALELPFRRMMVDLPQKPDEAQTHWRDELRLAARRAFDCVERYVGTDSRSGRAVVRARQQFERGLNQVLPNATAQTKGGSV